MSSTPGGGPPGAEQVRHEVLHRQQAVEDDLSADDEEGDTEAVR